jgi:hypothetical protein
VGRHEGPQRPNVDRKLAAREKTQFDLDESVYLYELSVRQRAGRRCCLSGFDLLGLVLHAARFDGDLHSIFHWILEGHLNSEEAVRVGRLS